MSSNNGEECSKTLFGAIYANKTVNIKTLMVEQLELMSSTLMRIPVIMELLELMTPTPMKLMGLRGFVKLLERSIPNP